MKAYKIRRPNTQRCGWSRHDDKRSFFIVVYGPESYERSKRMIARYRKMGIACAGRQHGMVGRVVEGWV